MIDLNDYPLTTKSDLDMIGGIQWTTALDYPGEIATVLFLKGCNFSCGFCHNTEIISATGSMMELEPFEVLQKLKKRIKLIDHVVISGGEPTIHDNALIKLLRELKLEGFKIKLDTNGVNPGFLTKCIAWKLVDYIAMDIKTVLDTEKYATVCGVDQDWIFMDDIKESIEKLKEVSNQNDITVEFRTTVMKPHHTPEIICELAEMGLPNHYFQQFVQRDTVLDKTLIPYSDEELKNIIDAVKIYCPNVHLRGI